jgi:hypothetical protein
MLEKPSPKIALRNGDQAGALDKNNRVWRCRHIGNHTRPVLQQPAMPLLPDQARLAGT